MDNFIKKLSVIDFLGFFLPGAVLTFFIQMKFTCLLVPFYSFFSADQNVILTFYFVGLSYLLGSLVHEISSLFFLLLTSIFPCLSNCLAKVHSEHLSEKGDALEKYNAVFTSEADRELIAKNKYGLAGKKVFHYVRLTGKADAAVLLLSISKLYRSLFVVFIILLILFWNESTVYILIFVISCLLSITRSIRFGKSSAEYTYSLFIKYK